MRARMNRRAVAAVAGAIAAGVLVGLGVRARKRNIRRFESEVASRCPLGDDGIVVGAKPFYLAGSATHAVLLIHGFGDTPQSMRPLADALHAAGWTVYAMLLPGHGRSLRQYARAHGEHWVAAVEAAYQELHEDHAVVVACGLSMGAALAVILAARHTDMPAVALLAPYLLMSRSTHMKSLLARFLTPVFPYHPNSGGEQSIHDAAARAMGLGTGVVTGSLLQHLRNISRHAHGVLPRVRARALYLQSREDNRTGMQDAMAQFPRLGSTERELRWLTGCGHIITVDHCKEEVARQVVEWFAPDFEASAVRHSGA